MSIGVQFHLIDATLHADAIHRGGGQIIPTARNGIYGAFLTAKPTIQQPMFSAQIHCSSKQLSLVSKLIEKYSGDIIHSTMSNGIMTMEVQFLLQESVDFLKEVETNHIFPSDFTLATWKNVEGDLYQETSPLNQLISQIRKSKGLQANIPTLQGLTPVGRWSVTVSSTNTN